MEFGDFSDILSALSTFGTLCVAYIAFRKAPEWLHQKMDEQAFFIANELITNDFPTIRSSLKECIMHLDFFVDCYDLIDAKIAFKDLDELSVNRIKIYNQLELSHGIIHSKITSLGKLGWTLNVLSYQNYTETNKGHSNCINKLNAIYKGINQINSALNKHESYDRVFEFQVKRLYKMSKEFLELYKNYSEHYSNFIDAGGTVPEYFDIKSIKITKIRI